MLSLTSAGTIHAEDRVQFNRDLRLILTDTCLSCHGPDKSHRQADLRLDVRESAIEKEAIVPGKPDESELVARIFSDDPNMVMPPPKSNKKLTPQQKELFKRWVAEGAEYQGHWAYERPVKPSVPAGPAAIDQLVRQRLAKLGLKPSPPADRRTLIRRLSYDLLGLPPLHADVDAFVNDPAADAYPKLVEKLLASPHYGERMAMNWLDAVRFADTIGYHSDTARNVYPYRDYVIAAFNTNKPFDQFTIEQIAGDLLPNSTQEQKVASCFNRLLLTTEEGGAQAKDYAARMLGDRVRAIGTVWLGQTFGCCQCHDHKFDPIKARDFYSMAAFFADVQEPAIGSRGPGMLLPNPQQSLELTRLQTAIAAQEQARDAKTPEQASAQAAWESAIRSRVATAREWMLLEPAEAKSAQGVKLKFEPDNTIFAERPSPKGIDTYTVTVKARLDQTTAFQLDVLPQSALPQQGPGRSENGNFVLSEFRVADKNGTPIPLAAARANFEQPGFPAAAAIDGKADKGNGWGVGGMLGADCSIHFSLAQPMGTGEEQTLVFTLKQEHGDNHTLGRFRLWATQTPADKLTIPVSLPANDLVALVGTDPAKRNAADSAKLTAYFKSMTPTLSETRLKLLAARGALTAYENTLPRCLVTVSGTPQVVRILPRGNWLDESGEIVPPALPAFLAGKPPAAATAGVVPVSAAAASAAPVKPVQAPTRLDLARWLVARDNPLTARVFVNRLWKQFFGIGLSKSLDDLGSQGEWPSNPELIDWLACEFMDKGWDVKDIVRTIVLSDTYQQSSATTPEQQERDPFNRELARQSRFRLDAEFVRDNALSISGLLAPKIGGPSVKPYQPDGYWDNLNFPVRQYVADTGEAQYRRGLYTWWQRTFPHPSMLAFDAPTREECAADRPRSNIPQQALVLLNDPTYVEAARAFALRILKQEAKDTDARITWAWQQALSRAPRDAERAAIKALIEKHVHEYAKSPENASGAAHEVSGLSTVPKRTTTPATADPAPAELAAWTNAARVILNLHEVITRN